MENVICNIKKKEIDEGFLLNLRKYVLYDTWKICLKLIFFSSFLNLYTEGKRDILISVNKYFNKHIKYALIRLTKTKGA